MTKKSFMDCERRNLGNMKKYQLPHSFKKAGVVVAVVSFVVLLLHRYLSPQEELKFLARYGIIIGLLITSISKERIEDELVSQLRMQSYTFAFITGVAYAILLPFTGYLVDIMSKTKEAHVKDSGDFQVLFLLLAVQVFYFEWLKKLHK
ncbi:MAG TPA: hypothetical protein VFV68_08940 [Agriterribacter sp.]|nr:hypothetical protein [Agriterribacter sp.]